jgi:hypothetical protein
LGVATLERRSKRGMYAQRGICRAVAALVLFDVDP